MPLAFKNGTISIYEVHYRTSRDEGSRRSERVHHFLQNAIRCQPSGRTHDSRQRVERADEDGIEGHALPPLVQA